MAMTPRQCRLATLDGPHPDRLPTENVVAMYETARRIS
jgi:hypothetical protein